MTEHSRSVCRPSGLVNPERGGPVCVPSRPTLRSVAWLRWWFLWRYPNGLTRWKHCPFCEGHGARTWGRFLRHLAAHLRGRRRLRKVVGIAWHDDRHGGHYWEVLSCGHEGRPIGLDGVRATQRWCDECKDEGRPQRDA